MTSGGPFTRNGNFNATLLAGSDSEASDDSQSQALGTGTGIDGVYQSGVSATTAVEGDWYDDTGTVVLYSADESSTVKATVVGPGSGKVGDRNSTSSTQIQISVKHSGDDSFSNNTANPYDPNGGAVLINSPSETSTATSGNDGNNQLSYTTGGITGTSTITATFQANISATGANGKFGDVATLTLHSTYLNVTINQSGLVATGQNGAVLLNDPNFEKTLPYSDAQTVTVTVPNVPNGTALNVDYASSLTTTLGTRFNPRQPGVDRTLPVGTSANDTTFNWSLTYNLA